MTTIHEGLKGMLKLRAHAPLSVYYGGLVLVDGIWLKVRLYT